MLVRGKLRLRGGVLREIRLHNVGCSLGKSEANVRNCESAYDRIRFSSEARLTKRLRPTLTVLILRPPQSLDKKRRCDSERPEISAACLKLIVLVVAAVVSLAAIKL